ncbi:response regulator transcription factor [Thermoflavimicrobium dichotomicum]|uniref:DNA-binding response regulator, OmpR family, contains REC and winged-helix (WHTH) domain n=1 Tax=Thermoflavimicrobium dichotomicum TaxID=46223 RepID=A0A1I3RYN2_9BACL|nr:response regulator transcription factor [Thermoflavimicrobium dichotomicum]SFJ51032.1 DNA-binding response regulator, OmpR family, contains REC and winged-helix (wHTH) domain [Thermoflavimicrobium dichotomicum]
MKSILVVDDEKKIREVVLSYLQKEGYQTQEAASGQQALEWIRRSPFDLIILDLMLPDLSGEEVCKKVRQLSSVPIIMLTAKVDEENRVQGLSLGADDYVVKPFSPRELMARVKAVLRRSSSDELLADYLSFNQGDLVIDTLKRQVWKQGKSVSVTPMEYRLLSILARHPERAFSREELIEKAFGFDFEGDIRTIDQHMKNLRAKIETDSKHPAYIQTVYGFGYRFHGEDAK